MSCYRGKFTKIAAGVYDSFGLFRNGLLTGWGPNTVGQINIPPEIGNNIAEFAPGFGNVLAVLKDGRVTGWGMDGLTLIPEIPEAIGNNATGIAVGYAHGLVLLKDGSVTGWGTYATQGQASVPTGIGNNAVALAAADFHSLALLKNGYVTGWGSNAHGQLTIPQSIQGNVTGIAAGLANSLALLKDGRVTGWGNNYYGQTNVPAGIGNNAVAIAGFYDSDHHLALLKDGRVTGWGGIGHFFLGELDVPPEIGNNATGIAVGSSHSLALLKDGTVTGWGLTAVPFSPLIPPCFPSECYIGQFDKVFAGSSKAFGIFKNGTISGWGYDAYIPVQIKNDVAEISAGYYHTLALLKDGRVTGWGYENFGGEISNLPSGNNATGIAAGSQFSLVLFKDGTITGYGRPFEGQIDIPIGIGNNAVAVAAGVNHGLALLNDGRITGWGGEGPSLGQLTIPQSIQGNVTGIAAGLYNGFAVLKDGSLTGFNIDPNIISPDISGRVKKVSTYFLGSHYLALLTDGSIVGGGRNVEGQLDIPPEISGKVTGIAAGPENSYALLKDGSIIGWGYEYGATSVSNPTCYYPSSFSSSSSSSFNFICQPTIGPIYFNQRFSQNTNLNQQFGYNTSINYLGDAVAVTTNGSGVYIYKSGLTIDSEGWYFQAKLTGESPEDISIGRFGDNAKLNGVGDIVIVSAPSYSGQNFTNNGAVYIYKKNNNNWDFFQKLTGISGKNEYFGRSLDINYLGDIITVSSLGDINNGKIYIYKSGQSDWELQCIVTGKPNTSSFSNSIALNQFGNILAFGAPYENKNSGKAYVVNWRLPNQIKLNNWELDENSQNINGIYTYQSINYPGGGLATGYQHASSNAVIFFETTNNCWSITSAVGNSADWYNNSPDSGNSGILPYTGWRLGNSLPAPGNPLTSGIINPIAKEITGDGKVQKFGIDLDINSSGDRILIGSLNSDEGSGAAYLFTGNNLNFILSKKFTGDNNGYTFQRNQAFGNKVSLNGKGDSVLISEHKDLNSNGSSAGAAYFFKEFNGFWSLTKKITGDADVDYGDNFGFSLNLNYCGNVAIIGAIGNGPQYKGAAYIYSDNNVQYSSFLDIPDVIYGDIPPEINCPIQNNINFLIKLDGENDFSLPYDTKHKFILYKSGQNTGYLPIYESDYLPYSSNNFITYSGIFDSGDYQIKIKSIYNDTNISFPDLCNSGVQVANLIDLSYSNKSGLALFKNSSAVLYKNLLNRNFNLNEVANVYFLDSLAISGFNFTNNFSNFINYTKALEPFQKTKEGVALVNAIDYAISNLSWESNKRKIINIITNNFPYIESDADDCEVLNRYFTNPIEIKYNNLLNKIATYSANLNISFNFIYIDKELNDEINKKNFFYNEKELKTFYAKAAQIGNGIFGDNSLSPIINSSLNLSKTLEQMKICEIQYPSSSSSSSIDCCGETPVCGFGEYLLITGFNFVENCGFCPSYICSGSQPTKLLCEQVPSGLYNGDNLSVTVDFISYYIRDRLIIWKSGCTYQYDCINGYSNINSFVNAITNSGALLFDSTCVGTTVEPAPKSYPYNWYKVANKITANNSFNFQSGDLPLGIIVVPNCDGGKNTAWKVGINLESTGYNKSIYLTGSDPGYCSNPQSYNLVVSASINLSILDSLLDTFTGNIYDTNYLDLEN